MRNDLTVRVRPRVGDINSIIFVGKLQIEVQLIEETLSPLILLSFLLVIVKLITFAKSRVFHVILFYICIDPTVDVERPGNIPA